MKLAAYSPFSSRGKNKLRYLTLFFIFIVVVALIVLVQYTFAQLQWERFHQNRLQAEALSLRLDKNLQEIIDEEEQRPISDYRFLSTTVSPTNNTSASFLQRSTLSQLPLQSKVPGIIGYFQLDTNNQFSTPLVPERREQAVQYGLSEKEYVERLSKVDELAVILIDNKLSIKTRAVVLESVAADSSIQKRVGRSPSQSKAEAGKKNSSSIDFDELKSQATFIPSNQLGRVDDLLEQSQNSGFDKRSRLADQQKSEQQVFAESKQIKSKESINSVRKKASPKRQLRKEQRVISETRSSSASLDDNLAELELNDDSNVAAPVTVEIFESEVEPFQVNVLESGHIVIFRRVWTQNQRFIQGMLIDKTRFIEAIIQKEFVNSALSESNRLAIAYQGNILAAYGEITKGNYGYLNSARQLSGTALYQKTLLSPFDDFNVVFTISDLSSGSSERVVLISALILLFTVLLGAWLFNRYASAQQGLMNQQQDFISSVSHELKTPLTSIRLYGEILKEGWASEDKKNEYYHFIFDESERLSRLINNVLQLAKLNRNTLTPDIKPSSIEMLINIIESKLSGPVLSQGFELTINNEISDRNQQIMVDLDEDLFVQVMINLVDNALKYASNAETKKVDVTFSITKKDRLSVSVRDYGPGIDPKKLDKVFNLFYRNENELTRETKGTGIGLALVAQYVQLMQGDVTALNQSPGLDVVASFPCHSLSS